MASQRGGGLWEALAWVIFPAVPVVLESAYNGNFQFPFAGPLSPDPRDWGWLAWLTELGPLVGFGFLAGATLSLHDEPTDRRGPRAWLGRRGVWVAVGPWSGFLVGAAALWAFTQALPFLPKAVGDWIVAPFTRGTASRWEEVRLWVMIAAVAGTFGYAWFLPAYAALRRAKRMGQLGKSVRRGLGVALAFVGSLFGSFWVVTEWWRTYFFDPRVVPVILAALSLALLCGCAPTLTYGEVRRRELFHSLLLAWTFGLALLWLWWGRPRTKPPSG